MHNTRLYCLLAWIMLAAVVLTGCGSGDEPSATSSLSHPTQEPATQSAPATQRVPTTPPAAAAASASPVPTPVKPVQPTAPPAPAASSITLQWSAPTENTNGTALTDLGGYKIYYGTSRYQLDSIVTLTNPGLLTYVIDGLTVGIQYYFAVTALATDGTESPQSEVVAAVIS
ncbi:MAG TPA: fibronectin type III domain-containing protein [Steroidobacteraceae bacterium]|nr:fibronectin type III domain-containing protein [Steroidobacteraceae bacterium]